MTVNETESRQLAERFNQLKAKSGMSQATFARIHKVPGGSSMVSQHVTGRRPISLEAATAYARGFGVTLAEISPRLAEAVRHATLGVPSTTGAPLPATSEQAEQHCPLDDCHWPFDGINVKQWASLPERTKGKIEGYVISMLGALDQSRQETRLRSA